MLLTTVILNVLILISLIFIGLFANNFLPEYLKKKAANVADKEDIAKITTEVESVRAEFTKHIEEVKGEITFLNDNRLNYKIEERQTILMFVEAINTWFYKSLNNQYATYSNSPDGVASRFPEIVDSYATVNICLAKMEILVHSDDILKKAKTLYSSVLNLSHYYQKYLLKFHHKGIEIELANKQLNQTETDNGKKGELFLEIQEKYKERVAINDDYAKNLPMYYAPIVEELDAFSKAIKFIFNNELKLNSV